MKIYSLSTEQSDNFLVPNKGDKGSQHGSTVGVGGGWLLPYISYMDICTD